MTTAVRATMSPRRARRRRTAKPAAFRERRPPPAKRTSELSTDAVVVMLAMSRLVGLDLYWIGLHHKIARCPWDAVFVRSVVNHRHVTAEIVMRRRSCRGPLERGGFPGIVGGFLAELH